MPRPGKVYADFISGAALGQKSAVATIFSILLLLNLPAILILSSLRGRLDRRTPLLDRADALHVELGPAIERVDAVLLLVDVGQLCVAIAEHVRVVEQRVAQAREARVDLVD